MLIFILKREVIVIFEIFREIILYIPILNRQIKNCQNVLLNASIHFIFGKDYYKKNVSLVRNDCDNAIWCHNPIFAISLTSSQIRCCQQKFNVNNNFFAKIKYPTTLYRLTKMWRTAFNVAGLVMFVNVLTPPKIEIILDIAE